MSRSRLISAPRHQTPPFTCHLQRAHLARRTHSVLVQQWRAYRRAAWKKGPSEASAIDGARTRPPPAPARSLIGAAAPCLLGARRRRWLRFHGDGADGGGGEAGPVRRPRELRRQGVERLRALPRPLRLVSYPGACRGGWPELQIKQSSLPVLLRCCYSFPRVLYFVETRHGRPCGNFAPSFAHGSLCFVQTKQKKKIDSSRFVQTKTTCFWVVLSMCRASSNF
jgi:hypothetical protein